MKQNKMRIIGVTGGIGAGKSEVLAYLEKRWHARTIRLDDLSRDLLQKDGACYQETAVLFGKEALEQDGTIDRAFVAQRIMEDETLRLRLDALIHPKVKEEAGRLLEKYEEEGAALCAVEAALLIEEHYDEICDEMWYIYASEKTRAARLLQNRYYGESRILASFQKQLTEGEFRRHADFAVDNDGEFSETEKQIDKRLMK